MGLRIRFFGGSQDHAVGASRLFRLFHRCVLVSSPHRGTNKNSKGRSDDLRLGGAEAT
jgi:hypothetical protein